jgi:AsmA family protein
VSRHVKYAAWSVTGLLATLALCVVVVATFDWNRAKPWLNAHVSEATGRPFAIRGDLSVQWHRPDDSEAGGQGWIPWPHIHARDIVFGNPAWVKDEPAMGQVGRATFSLNPLALLVKKILVRNLLLEQPLLFLQRARNGDNNWTFNAGRSSGWQFDIEQLGFHKGEVHVVDAVKRANLVIHIDTVNTSAANGGDFNWNVIGTLGGDAISGRGKAGAILSLQRQNTRYPVEAELHVGKTAIAFKGTLTNPRALGALDVRLKVSAVSMAKLYELTSIPFPETPAFSTEGHLTGTIGRHGSAWSYENFSGKVGASDLSGTLEYQAKQPRPYLKATLVSGTLRLQDLAPLIGADSSASKINRGAATRQPADRILPVEPFNTARWTDIDADVKFTGRKILHDRQLPIANLAADLHLQDGVLSLAPLAFTIAGGNLISTIVLDGRSTAMKAQVRIAARHLKLKQLLPTFQSMQASLGEVNGNASLSATGNSIAAMLGTSNGEIKAFIDGGSVSKLMLEKIGLNIGNVILMQLSGDKQVILRCMASDFSLTNGVMQARTFVVDTDDALLELDGQINLAQERLALTVRTHTKSLRMISLRAPFYVSGSFKQPKVSVDKGVLAMKVGAAVTLGVLAPALTAVIPLVNLGPDESSACATLLTEARTKPVAPVPGTGYRARRPPASSVQ